MIFMYESFYSDVEGFHMPSSGISARNAPLPPRILVASCAAAGRAFPAAAGWEAFPSAHGEATAGSAVWSSGLLNTRDTWTYWVGSSEGLQRGFWDWSISFVRNGWESLGWWMGILSINRSIWGEGVKRMEPDYYWCPVTRPEAQVSPSEYQQTLLFSLWGWLSAGTGCVGTLWSLYTRNYSEAIWTWLWAVSFCKQGVHSKGLDSWVGLSGSFFWLFWSGAFFNYFEIIISLLFNKEQTVLNLLAVTLESFIVTVLLWWQEGGIMVPAVMCSFHIDT